MLSTEFLIVLYHLQSPSRVCCSVLQCVAVCCSTFAASVVSSAVSITPSLSFRVYAMGWLRIVGSLKLQVSFAEYSLLQKSPMKRDYILQKRPIILRSLLTVATPYSATSKYAKEPYKRNYILQKRPIILRSLLTVATPYSATSKYAIVQHLQSLFIRTHSMVQTSSASL